MVHLEMYGSIRVEPGQILDPNSTRARGARRRRDVHVVRDAPGSAGTRAKGEHGDDGARAERESRRWDDRVGVRGVRDVGVLWSRSDDGDDAWNGGGDDDGDVRFGISRTKDGDGFFSGIVERWFGDDDGCRGKYV